VVFNTGPYTVLPDNSILITANMQSETGFPSSHQLKSYVASKSRLKLAASAVLSADAGLLVVVTASFLCRISYREGCKQEAGGVPQTKSKLNVVSIKLCCFLDEKCAFVLWTVAGWWFE